MRMQGVCMRNVVREERPAGRSPIVTYSPSPSTIALLATRPSGVSGGS